MKVIAVSVGSPQVVQWAGRSVSTSIFKHPVEGPVRVGRLNLNGDQQADLSVHGGVEKAAYAYPREHYSYWRAELGELPLPPGSFGENLTIEGLSEEDVRIGDHLQIGSALFQVTQPRTPCYKLSLRFGRNDMTRLFYASRRYGWYLSLVHEGVVQAGDAIVVARRDPNNVSVADVVRLFTDELDDDGLLQRTLRVEALPESWRVYLQRRVKR